jgi:mannose-1-phosphate guanylyltransferase
MKIIPVILAGGKGERFWPLSRIVNPKQSLKLISEDPLILDTFNRLKTFTDFAVIANANLCQDFRKILPNHVTYIEEPMARNTASAIGLACISLMERFGDCIAFFETADHYYKDPIHYLNDIFKACAFAEQSNKIVLIGIVPTEPHTGYGYIKNGSQLSGQIYEVKSFKEKPTLNVAKQYLQEGGYLWNSGMFIAKCSVLLQEIHTNLPDLYSRLLAIKKSGFDPKILQSEFEAAPKVSIDYGVMEKSQNTAVLNSMMDWDDIGDFNAMARILPLDDDGNLSKGKLCAIDSQNNIIISEKLVGLIGVKNLVIVETPDAILICDKTETQKIRQLVQQLDSKYK